MDLRGQHDGYAMAALLVGLAVSAVLLTVAMPVWTQLAQREKEAELIFRGQQYARAIGLFQRRAGPGVLPPNLDVLVEQRFLRKKYKDPITNGDFLPLLAGRGIPGAPQPGSTPPVPAPTAAGRQRAAPPGSQAGGRGTPPDGRAQSGIVGVVSKSRDKSIRLYNGRNYYNEWQFVFSEQTQTPGVVGGPAPGRSGSVDGPDRRPVRGRPSPRPPR